MSWLSWKKIVSSKYKETRCRLPLPHQQNVDTVCVCVFVCVCVCVGGGFPQAGVQSMLIECTGQWNLIKYDQLFCAYMYIHCWRLYLIYTLFVQGFKF